MKVATTRSCERGDVGEPEMGVTAHAKFGPSGAHRWIPCPASIRECEGLPDETSWEAAEGTAFHWLVEVCLRTGLEPKDFLGHKRLVDGFEFTINDDMCAAARNGLFFLRQFENEPDAKIFIEQRVDLSNWLGPDQFGTLDVGIILPRKREIVVWDWKYGRGVPVYAEKNDQIITYGGGFWDTVAWQFMQSEFPHDDVTFRLCIEQPRILGAGGEWRVTLREVFDHMEKARRSADLARSEDAPYNPGEKQCQWCPARTTCNARAEYLLNIPAYGFERMDRDDLLGREPRLPSKLTPARLSYIFRHRKAFKAWLEEIEAKCYAAAERGDPVPSLKLVEGRHPARRYRENQKHHAEVALAAVLGEDAYQKTLLSPAQAEDALKRVDGTFYEERLAEFVDLGKPGVMLVPEEDRRPAIKSTLDMFLEGESPLM